MTSSSVGSGLHQLDSAADLLVFGSCTRGLSGRVLVGDDTRASLNGASCAVAIAPHRYADHPKDIRTIGVAYNHTPEAEAALAVAHGLAAEHDATVRALTADSPASGAGGRWASLGEGWGEMIETLEHAAKDRLRSLDGVDGQFARTSRRRADRVYGRSRATRRRIAELRPAPAIDVREHLGAPRPHNGCPLFVLPRSAASEASALGGAGRSTQS
jgi:hypothetical protein